MRAHSSAGSAVCVVGVVGVDILCICILITHVTLVIVTLYTVEGVWILVAYLFIAF